MLFKATIAAAVFLATTGIASADTAVIGAVRDIHRGGYGGVVEYHWTETLAAKPNWSAGWAGAAHTEADDDSWIGFGVSGEYPLSDKVFLEGSFMPGYYSQGATDLGGNLHFRSTLGFGMNISDNYAISFALSHWSNGSIEKWNPGTDMAIIRLSIRH
ncbi:acyloxyacyl hydrolase [Rhodobacterales bacterium HKCCD6035]|nr:acyloxyacyl hydrolase [Rhodobacterales bacterium HKCCD6035]